MNQQLIEKVMKQVSEELGSNQDQACKPADSCPASQLTEFIGIAQGNTIGLLIASVDPLLKEAMGLGKYSSLGIIGSRTGAGPQIMAVDDAVKATNTEIISIELPRDSEGGAVMARLSTLGRKMYPMPNGPLKLH